MGCVSRLKSIRAFGSRYANPLKRPTSSAESLDLSLGGMWRNRVIRNRGMSGNLWSRRVNDRAVTPQLRVGCGLLSRGVKSRVPRESTTSVVTGLPAFRGVSFRLCRQGRRRYQRRLLRSARNARLRITRSQSKAPTCHCEESMLRQASANPP